MPDIRDDDSSPADVEPVEPEISDPDSGESKEGASGKKARRTTAELTITRTELFSGPLPHPDLLKGYNGAFAGCAERVVALTEKQSAHRQRLEQMVVEANCSAQSRGQWFAFILAFLVIGGGVYLLAQGESIQGFAAIILAVASIIGALVYSQTEQRKEREKKLRPLPEDDPAAPN